MDQMAITTFGYIYPLRVIHNGNLSEHGSGGSRWTSDPHSGKRCQGRTPMQTFVDGKKVIREKMLAA